MPDVLENTFPLTAGGDAKPFTELDAGGCFAPFIPQISVSPAPRAAPKLKPFGMLRAVDKFLGDRGWDIPAPIDSAPETESSVPEAVGSTGDTPTTGLNEILNPSVNAPLPVQRMATAIELLTWVNRSLLAQTSLQEDAAEKVAFWAVSTWFQDCLSILPGLVITGSAHDGWAVLRVLGDLCRRPALLAGFQRSHLGTLRGGVRPI